jgi:hypothetical protein
MPRSDAPPMPHSAAPNEVSSSCVHTAKNGNVRKTVLLARLHKNRRAPAKDDKRLWIKLETTRKLHQALALSEIKQIEMVSPGAPMTQLRTKPACLWTAEQWSKWPRFWNWISKQRCAGCLNCSWRSGAYVWHQVTYNWIKIRACKIIQIKCLKSEQI